MSDGHTEEINREYGFGLRSHLEDVLSGFDDDEIDRVFDHLEEEVYNKIMEGAEA